MARFSVGFHSQSLPAIAVVSKSTRDDGAVRHTRAINNSITHRLIIWRTIKLSGVVRTFCVGHGFLAHHGSIIDAKTQTSAPCGAAAAAYACQSHFIYGRVLRRSSRYRDQVGRSSAPHSSRVTGGVATQDRQTAARFSDASRRATQEAVIPLLPGPIPPVAFPDFAAQNSFEQVDFGPKVELLPREIVRPRVECAMIRSVEVFLYVEAIRLGRD